MGQQGDKGTSQGVRWNYPEIIPADDAFRYRPSNTLADEGLVVMPFHGRCIDSPEAGFDCFIDEVGGAVFFPGCAVDEGWHFGEGWGRF